MTLSPSDTPLRVAVVGGGIAGLSAAWMLGSRHSVTLFEADTRLGGHANTVEVAGAEGRVPVDTGFIVYNEANYPNFTALLRHLNVPSQPADMALSVSLDDGAFEYSSGAIFAQKRNLLSRRFWAMLRDVTRFYRDAPKDLAALDAPLTSLDDYLVQQGYGRAFRDDHLIPFVGYPRQCTMRKRAGKRSPGRMSECPKIGSLFSCLAATDPHLITGTP